MYSLTINIYLGSDQLPIGHGSTIETNQDTSKSSTNLRNPKEKQGQWGWNTPDVKVQVSIWNVKCCQILLPQAEICNCTSIKIVISIFLNIGLGFKSNNPNMSGLDCGRPKATDKVWCPCYPSLCTHLVTVWNTVWSHSKNCCGSWDICIPLRSSPNCYRILREHISKAIYVH